MNLTEIPTSDLAAELARRGWKSLRADISIGDLTEEIQAYDNAEPRDEWPALIAVARRFMERAEI